MSEFKKQEMISLTADQFKKDDNSEVILNDSNNIKRKEDQSIIKFQEKKQKCYDCQYCSKIFNNNINLFWHCHQRHKSEYPTQ